jgi:hypothetical protein
MKDLPDLENSLRQVISVQDAYRVMEHFVSAYLARGDTSVSDFLFCYAGLTAPGQTADPAAIHDFLESTRAVAAQSPPGPYGTGA